MHQYDLVTTLTDASSYTKDDLAELYFRRWAVELYFRQIKTTMGMEKLRCRTPRMVRKELRMHLIAYNLIRGLMQEAAQVGDARLDRISFKGAVDTLRQFSNALNATKGRLRVQQRIIDEMLAVFDPLHAFQFTKGRPRVQQRIIAEMLAIIAEETVPERKHRSEPRAVKERPKPYPRLTSHRSVYVVPKSRKQKGKRRSKIVDKTS